MWNNLNDSTALSRCKFVQIVHSRRMEDQLTTTEAAKIASVAPSTIKRWADEGALQVTRTLGGHRRLSRESLEKFLDSRTVRTGLEEEGDAAFVEALLSGNRFLVDAQLLLMRARTKSWYEVAERLGGFLMKVGQAWVAGELTIFQEHVISEALSRGISRMGDSFATRPGAPRCALVCAPGEKHTLGLSLAELCVRELGWVTRWLGNNTPVEEVERVVQTNEVDWLIVAGSGLSNDQAFLEKLTCRLESVCQKYSTRLVLGGSAAWPKSFASAHRLTNYTSLSQLLKNSDSL